MIKGGRGRKKTQKRLRFPIILGDRAKGLGASLKESTKRAAAEKDLNTLWKERRRVTSRRGISVSL